MSRRIPYSRRVRFGLSKKLHQKLHLVKLTVQVTSKPRQQLQLLILRQARNQAKLNLPRVGHKIQFVEDKGLTQKGAYIETAGSHKLRINDSQKFVAIETKGGHKLRLDDRMRSITLSSTGNIDINAKGIVTITGKLIKLN